MKPHIILGAATSTDEQRGQRSRSCFKRPRLPLPNELADDAWGSVAEVAGVLSIGVSTVWNRVASGVLPAPSYALGKRFPRWRLGEIRRVMEQK